MVDKRILRGQRIVERMAESGIESQEDLADAIGCSQGAISQLIAGTTNRSRLMPEIADNLAINLAWLEGETDEKIEMFDENGDRIHEFDLVKRALRDGTAQKSDKSTEVIAADLNVVALREIDLTFGMGATYMEVPVTTAIRYFSRDWLRIYTGADPDHLYFAQGIGDSMAPTILDSDLLLIDASQKNLNMADKFWAVAYGNMGSVKRLRGLPNGGVEMISDNPLVPNSVAYDDELHILGRVVAIVRRT